MNWRESEIKTFLSYLDLATLLEITLIRSIYVWYYRQSGIDRDNISESVELDYALTSEFPGPTKLHYEVITKQ